MKIAGEHGGIIEGRTDIYTSVYILTQAVYLFFTENQYN